MRCIFMKRLKILIVKVTEFGNPSTKNIDRSTLLCVLKYFKSNEIRLLWNFSQKKKKIVPKYVCSMVKFSMPAILDRILHLASQTMYWGLIPGGGSHIWNGYGCKARAPTGWGIRWEHRLKKWGVIGWEHDFWHPVREKSKNMRSYWSKNEGSLGESTIFFIRWVKFGIRWEKNIKIYGVFGWEHMRL